jgi:hypothetical protein
LSLLFIPNQNKEQEEEEQICIGGRYGEIELYGVEHHNKTTTYLLQVFPNEHSSFNITSLIHLKENTLISSACSNSSSPSSNVIVIWSKSKSSLVYEPIQRITRKEAGGGIRKLVVLEQKNGKEEEFASCSSDDDNSVLIWSRVKGKEEKFQIKQKITNAGWVQILLYISQTNELIFAPSSSLLQIWSSFSSSVFKEIQEIKTSSGICSFCQINENSNENRNRIEFASGHENGQIMIWSKQPQLNESKYSLSKTLRPFKECISGLIFINNNGLNFLISCCSDENKIVIYKNKKEKAKENLRHNEVMNLIPMSNGIFASGGGLLNECLHIWSPSSSSFSTN